MIFGTRSPPLPCGCRPDQCFVTNEHGQLINRVMSVDTEKKTVRFEIRKDLSEVVKMDFKIKCVHGFVNG